jgi:hypothetical protein
MLTTVVYVYIDNKADLFVPTSLRLVIVQLNKSRVAIIEKSIECTSVYSQKLNFFFILYNVYMDKKNSNLKTNSIDELIHTITDIQIIKGMIVVYFIHRDQSVDLLLQRTLQRRKKIFIVP